jgi:RNA polymerase sigma factor (sigma-70 family)
VAVSDEQLMQRAAAGDVQAFGELFDRYHPRLLGFLTRFTGDEFLAQDLVQDTFWRAWEYRQSFLGGSAFSAWIYTIAKNAAASETRKSYRKVASLTDAVEAVGHDDLAESLTLREQVRFGLQQLPPEQRLSLILREYEGLSHEEIAEVMGCSPGAARVLAHRARKALARVLRPLLESEDCCVG